MMFTSNVDTATIGSPPNDGLRHAMRRVRDFGGLALLVLGLALAILMFAGHFQLSQAQELQAQELRAPELNAPSDAQSSAHHNHPPQDAALHEMFYSSWMMPDHPNVSCCNKQDCYPTEARYRDGFWEARRREDGHFVRIPWEKVEQRRDNPDGRNHVCMPSPERSPRGDEVYCFVLGGGT
jgi:hypothetical protein